MKSTKQFWYGVAIGILGVVLFSSKAVMVKLSYNHNVDPVSLLLLRMLFSFPFYVVIAFLYRNQNIHITKTTKDYCWVVFFGFIGYYLASYFDFIGLIYIKASLERIILFLYPTVVILLNRLFLKQRINNLQRAAIGVTYLGIVITFYQEIEISGPEAYLGGFFILLSAITYASYLVGSGWLIPKFGVMKFTAYAMIVSCICVFIHYSFINGLDLTSFSREVYLLGFLIAIFATVIPSFLVSASIRMINSSNFAIVAGLGPVSTIILAAVFLNESLTLLQLFGTLVVIISILIVSLKKGEKV
ncbi:DMT family transporter [Cognatitamlana onchidii]|uniref:DMT family transporter n=1 Tax=Cognatitamlana onchidii TaxID=2562860 RepID=UPI0010A63721|nr:DMT family transporter [Algibacter onchidii]